VSSLRWREQAAEIGRGLAEIGAGLAFILTLALISANAETIRATLLNMSALAQVQPAAAPTPLLVTFGPEAPVNEGDHDFRQLIRFSVPAEAGRVDVRVFDPDTGGAFDEQGGAVTVTRFSLFGAGAAAKLGRDAEGVVQESVDGAALDSKEFARDGAIDGQWSTLFSVGAGQGAEEAGGRRSFVLLVEGVSGNGGNVFDVAVMRANAEDDAPEGLKLYSFMPTFQVPRGNLLAEFALDVPAGVKALTVENFDAASGSIAFAGKFRSVPLTASAKSQWQSDEVGLAADEPGTTVSLTAAKGRESPNDMTVFVGEAGGDAADRPVAINLPLRALPPNRRPEIALNITPRACSQMHFDAAGSRDPDGGALSYRWVFDGSSSEPAADGAALEKSFPRTGTHSGRLEVFDASGMIGNGTAQDFSFFVKAPPVARFAAPELVAEGAAFTLDGTASSSPAVPEIENAIASYRWSLGDGTVVEQRRGEAGFGKLEHRYAAHGTYTVTLTVTDSAENPCNTAIATRTVTVNAPPVANAGGNRRLALGDTLTLDAGSAADVDGDTVRFRWDFGDGASAEGAEVSHRFERAGTYRLMLTADDGRGAENSVAVDRAEIFVNAAPSGDTVRIPDELISGMAGEFDASGATDSDGKIARMAWAFGDGATSDKPTVRHSFAKAGSYDVTLTLTDDSGLSNASTVVARKVTVVDASNQAPVVDAGGDRETTVDAVLVFDAKNSRDPDGSILAYRWDFGDGAQADGIAVQHAYRSAGTYSATLTVTDDSGRENATTSTAFDVVVRNRENLSPVLQVGGDRAAFVKQIVEFDATRSADGDGRIIAVEWDFGDGARAAGLAARHAYAAPGAYQVRVVARDDSGRPNATGEASFTVTVTHAPNRAPDVEMAVERHMHVGVAERFDASAATDPDGLITRYRWEFGDGSGTDEPGIDHAYARPGAYSGTLTLVDDSGLDNGTTVKKFTVHVDERPNEQPVARAGADAGAIVGQRIDLDGSASSDSDGSLIGYDWDFGNGKTEKGIRSSIAYFEPGTYTVTLKVTDNSGQANATATDTLTVAVLDKPNLPPEPKVDADRPAAIAEPVSFTGQGTRDPDGNILSYDWDFGDGATARGRDVVHAYAKSGIYTARLTVTDDSGLGNAPASIERRIVVNEPPVAAAGPDQHVTASVVSFDASKSVDSDGEIATFLWDFGDGQSAAGARVAHTYRSPGEYRVQLKIADDAGTIRNEAEDDLTVRINAPPVADAGFDVVAAPGEAVTFDGRRSIDPDGKIARYRWDFGDGATAEGDVVTHGFTKPGRYTVELGVADDSGHADATDFSQIVAVVNRQPVADAGPDMSVAPGQKFILSGDGSSDGDGTITSWRWDIERSDRVLVGPRPELSLEQPGIYTLRLTVTDDSSANNRTAQDDVVVHVNERPVAEAGRDIFSDSLRVVLDGTASVDADDDGLTYSWDFGDGNTGHGAMAEHTYATGGIYPVVLTVDDGRRLANSKHSDAMTVRINRPPLAAAGDNKRACIGDIVVFDGSSSSDPDSGLLRYKWDFGDGGGADIVNPTTTYAAPGSYRVELKVTDESGLRNASSADDALITVLPAPVARAGDDMKVCANTAVRFDGRASTDVDGVVNRFSWDFGDGQAGGGDQPEHTYLEAGTYRATLQIEGDNLGLCAPVSSDELIVTVQSAPKPAISAPSAAATMQEIIFDGTGSSIDGQFALGYEWDFGDGSSGTGAVVKHAYAKPGRYQAKLRVTAPEQAGGCASTQLVHLVTVNASPVADAGFDRTVEVNRPLLLSGAASSDPDGGIASYRWDFGDGETASGVETRHIWRKAGRHRVTLTVDDGTGLSNATNAKSVWIDVTPPPKVEIASEKVACTGAPVAFSLTNVPSGMDQSHFAWSFGDGSSVTGGSVAHSFGKPGTYMVGVTGPLDRAGTIEPTPVTKMLVVNQPPVARIAAQRKACPGATVSFDAGASFDPDGKVTAYAWDFGDGATAKGAKVEHAFAKPGTYPVTLTVTDESGSACGTGVATLDLFVDAPPVASAGPDTDIFIGGAQDSLVLDASGSHDPDGDGLSHHWSLSNGMELDGEKLRVELAKPGSVTATLTTTDPHGLACSIASDIVQITARARAASTAITD
jgi:PKD repeat protein